MRPSSVLLLFLLVLHLLLCGAYGARLGKFGMKSAATTQHTDVEKKSDVKKEENDNSAEKGKIRVVCKDEDHDCVSKGKSRNLVTSTTMSTSTSSPIQENGKKYGANKSMEVSSKKYEDLLDMTEMDYSPAKRKPPIHN